MIYARLDTETEPPTLDWGHDVYPAAGHTIEELGYKEFASLEEAREYYGVTEGLEPEDLITE